MRISILLYILYGFNWRVSGQGSPIDIEDAPWTAALVAPSGGKWQLCGGKRQLCGASVVHERFVLTAASCLVGVDISIVKVLVGTAKLHDGGNVYDVEAIIPHSKYFQQTGDYNVALVKVQRIVFGSEVGKVPLGKMKLAVGTPVDVMGWGSNGNKPPSRSLRQTSVRVIRASACRRGFGRVVTSRELCAGHAGAGRGDCVSDEGGPVIFNGTLVGVVTSFSGCGRLPGLYTRLAAVRGWVTAAIEDNLTYLDYLDEAAEGRSGKNLLR